MVTITVLCENTGDRDHLITEHGLSLYVETPHRRILFDMGQSDAFARNAAALGIDLSLVDLAVVSHGHYDHGGGLAAFLAINRHAPIYLHRTAFEGHYHGAERYIGLDTSLSTSDRFVPLEGELRLAHGITLSDCNHHSLPYEIQPYGLDRLQDGVLLPEDFRHEIYLSLQDEGRSILFSGCSHKGVLNLAAHFSPDLFVGGFHLSQLDPHTPSDAAALQQTADVLLSFPTRYYTCHCTGEAQYLFLKQRMGERIRAIRTGDVITLPEQNPA